MFYFTGRQFLICKNFLTHGQHKFDHCFVVEGKTLNLAVGAATLFLEIGKSNLV